MGALLGKARIVDDPPRDRPVPLYPRHNHLAHLGQNDIVRPAALADKMQQRLVLRRRPLRCRQGRHRLNALAFTRHQQTRAVIQQRLGPIGVTDHRYKPIHIS
jgi:hypothetical protein